MLLSTALCPHDGDKLGIGKARQPIAATPGSVVLTCCARNLDHDGHRYGRLNLL